MNDQTKNEVIEEVKNEGKIPEDNTSSSKSKSITKSFKITPSQNERLEADMAKGNFKSFSEYALHTNTLHTHFHILVCNTKISDGKQISMSDSDLKCFKEHSSSVFRRLSLMALSVLL